MKSSTSYLPAIFVLLILLNFNFVQAQCPANEADLADGGTFSGTCSVPVGASITITGDVIWTSGTLTITDGGTNPGDIIIAASGSLTVNGGTVQTGDATDGSLEVNGDLTIASGATVSIHDEIHIENGGTADISGRLERLENSGSGNFNSVFIDGGGTMTINSGGVLSTNSSTIPEGNALWDMLNVQGTLISAGTIHAMDVLVDGTDGEGILTIETGGILNANDNLQVFNGGVITIKYGATVNVTDEAYNSDNLPNPGAGTTGTFNIYGTLNVGTDLTIIATTPDSGLFGGGTIDVGGTYTDGECPTVGDFCSCTGTAVGACAGSGTLPVTWTNFNARLINDGIVLLEWTTATEINNEGFYVERSKDGLDFTTLGFLSGNGNSNEVNSYNFTDDEIFSGTYYYRLKQVDYDGVFDYSKLVVLHVEELNVNRQIVVYPNPTAGNIQLQGLVDDSYNLSLYSNTGQVLLHEPAIRMQNIEEVINNKLPLLKRGIYHIKLENSLQVSNLKLILN